MATSSGVLRVLILFCLLTACQPAPLAAPSGITYTSNGGNFSVLMPGTPTTKHETVNMGNALGDIGIFSYIYEASDNSGFAVHYADFPADVMARASPYAILDGIRDEAISIVTDNGDAEVLNQKNISYHDQYPGREVRVETTDGGTEGAIRIYVVKARVFIIAGVMEKNIFNESGVDQFLDSFTLLRP